MKIRFMIDGIFEPTETTTIADFKTKLIALQSKMQRINAFETSRIVIQKCYHDEGKPQSCEVIFSWEKV